MARARDLNRRHFVAGAGAAALGGLLPPRSVGREPRRSLDWVRGPRFDAWVRSLMESEHLPGLAVGVLDEGKPLRVAGFGWANLAQRRPMTPDTLMNIASVTKTVTGAAIMQLWEAGRFRLDDDVSGHLPFPLRNPAFADAPITIRQLLTHSSSIADGPAYWDDYVCGDHPRGMGSWLRDYFSSSGPLYDATGNFQPWAPGTQARYSNVGYAVLGHLVECVSGVPYEQYCSSKIFAPLRMSRTRFRLDGMEPHAHATPYSYVESAKVTEVKLRDSAGSAPPTSGWLHVPLCPYSFVTTADGLVRTSAAELARFLLAFIHGGALDGHRILRAETLAQIFSDQHVRYSPEDGDHANDMQGLTWFRRSSLGPDPVWGHNGGDPGVCTLAAFRPGDGRGVVVLTNGSPDRSARRQIARAVFLSPSAGGLQSREGDFHETE
jgi:CubicO group peptidase (beta-lactamase class C family)